jgi:hypothetical protein
MTKRDPADDLPDEDVTAIDEIPVYSINKPKPESLVVLKILDNMKEGGRLKMMKKGRLIEELEEASIIDKNRRHTFCSTSPSNEMAKK